MKRHYKTPLIGRLSIPSPRLLAASVKGDKLYGSGFDSSKEALGRESDDWDDDE